MSDSINVPLKARTHELQQLQDFLPKAVEKLYSAGLEDEANSVARSHFDHVRQVETTYPDGPEFAAYISMPADDWWTTLQHIDRLGDEEGLKVWWLRKKLADRLVERLEELE